MTKRLQHGAASKNKKKNDVSKFKIIENFTQGLLEFINSYVSIRKLGILDFAIRNAIIRYI